MNVGAQVTNFGVVASTKCQAFIAYTSQMLIKGVSWSR